MCPAEPGEEYEVQGHNRSAHHVFCSSMSDPIFYERRPAADAADVCADTSKAPADDTAVPCRTGKAGMRCRAATAARTMCSAVACQTRSTTRAAPCRIPATPVPSAAW